MILQNDSGYTITCWQLSQGMLSAFWLAWEPNSTQSCLMLILWILFNLLINITVCGLPPLILLCSFFC